jgi:hypothetical protein
VASGKTLIDWWPAQIHFTPHLIHRVITRASATAGPNLDASQQHLPSWMRATAIARLRHVLPPRLARLSPPRCPSGSTDRTIVRAVPVGRRIETVLVALKNDTERRRNVPLGRCSLS